MCLRPIYIQNKAIYSHPAVTSSMVQVSCNNCDACRDARKSMWEDRLCLEVSDWYNKGGIGLMLTLTYNNACLPYFHHAGKSVPCFSSSDILAFLSRVKTRCQRLYGNDFYRYFVCSEYGKNTQRPHYHVWFLIRDEKYYHEFVEMCRECWCWLYLPDANGIKRPVSSLGFLFPKFDGKHYVDDKGRNKDPRFRSKKAGAKYVCKYICKDLDYYALPEVKEFENLPQFQDKKPKSWKSNNLGFSPIADIVARNDPKEIELLLQHGIWCDIAQKYVKLWDSAIARLMYNNVWNGRISKRNGNKLYDRELSEFGYQYLWFAFKMRVARTTQKMYERALALNGNAKLRALYPLTSQALFIRSDFAKHALFHCLLSQQNILQLASRFQELGNNFDAFMTIDNWESFYMLKHDSCTLSSCEYPFHTDVDTHQLLSLLEPFYKFEDNYKQLSIYLENCSVAHYKERGEQIRRAKQAGGVYGFPQNLC